MNDTLATRAAYDDGGTMGNYTPMTRDAAASLTREIVSRVGEVWDLITIAYNRRAWSAMGYETWDAYCRAEFADARLRIPREQRAEKVESLRKAGLSTRAIASATGDSATTIRRSLQAVEQPARITGTDGRSHPTARVRRPRAERTIVVTAQDIENGRRAMAERAARDVTARVRRARPRVDTVGTDDGGRERVAPVNIDNTSWKVLDLFLQQYVDNPPPMSDLTPELQRSLARNMAAIVSRVAAARPSRRTARMQVPDRG